MSEPAKDEAELLERIAGCIPAWSLIAAIRAAGWAVVPARLTKDMEYDALRAENARLRGALADMYAGWRYIRLHYGDLSGVGWERCDAAARAALEAKS